MKPSTIIGFLSVACLTTVPSVWAEDTAEGLAFFEKKIRPVLVNNCYKCHSAKSEKVKGELLLDTKASARKGGESGPAVVPRDLKKSLLIEAVRWTNDDLQMPPKKKLSAAQIMDLERWVQMGAPDPRTGGGVTAIKRDIDIEAGKKFWAFQPIKTTPPKLKNRSWAHTDIDRHVLAGLEAKGLQPVADADKRTLIRRVYYDLTGLPPSPDNVAEFLSDNTPKALEKVVDRLLASSHFGERWGRHWLDVVRYAESNGMERNAAFPHAWRYRDYVIDSFNSDKPFDEFITMGNLAHFTNLRVGRVWLREAQVGGQRSIEQEIILEHDAEMSTILPEAN